MSLIWDENCNWKLKEGGSCVPLKSFETSLSSLYFYIKMQTLTEAWDFYNSEYPFSLCTVVWCCIPITKMCIPFKAESINALNPSILLQPSKKHVD
jgi:hypothetical protein